VPQVWVIDDDDEMNHAVSLMLGLLGYEAQTFIDPRPAAHKLLAGERPHAIILDINMPEVSGIDMLEFVRRRPELAAVPVVMLSTETTDVQVDEALEMGADDFVFKPVTMEELERAIAQAAAKRRLG
jgi:DNA-binding response OmpR family regulator